jgi:hypothetical protein
MKHCVSLDKKHLWEQLQRSKHFPKVISRPSYLIRAQDSLGDLGFFFIHHMQRPIFGDLKGPNVGTQSSVFDIKCTRLIHSSKIGSRVTGMAIYSIDAQFVTVTNSSSDHLVRVNCFVMNNRSMERRFMLDYPTAEEPFLATHLVL